MTKSQNTKNEQQKDLCITSEQLTEQWKKGELPNGWYYVKGSKSEGIYAYTAEYLNNMYRPINGEKVLAPVPSYDEWQEKLEENAQLKELLKEYKNQLSEIKNAYIDLTTQDEYGSYYIDEAKLFVEIIGKTIKL